MRIRCGFGVDSVWGRCGFGLDSLWIERGSGRTGYRYGVDDVRTCLASAIQAINPSTLHARQSPSKPGLLPVVSGALPTS